MNLRQLVFELTNGDVFDHGDELALNCPFCLERVGKRDTKHRLGLNTRSGIGHCYRCEKKYKGKQSENIRYWFRELCRVFGVVRYQDKLPSDEDTPVIQQKEKAEKVTLPDAYEPLWKEINDTIGKQAYLYMTKERRVTHDQIKKHKIGFCAVGPYAYRIVLPIYSRKRKLVAFVTRDITGKSKMKYKNSPGAKAIFNIPKQPSETANLCEGPLDALSAERALSDEDCVATLGAATRDVDMDRLSCYRTVVIWPDPDVAGVNGAIKKAIALQKRGVYVLMVLPLRNIEDDVDLGKMKIGEIKQRRESAMPYTPLIAAIMRNRVADLRGKNKIRKISYNNRVERRDERGESYPR